MQSITGDTMPSNEDIVSFISHWIEDYKNIVERGLGDEVLVKTTQARILLLKKFKEMLEKEFNEGN